MSGFNSRPKKATNKCGHAAFDMKPKEKLATQVLTTFFNEPKFYGDNSNEILENAAKMCHEDPEFVAKLAVYARTKLNMRSVSHALCAVLAHEVKDKQYVRNAIRTVGNTRGDDLVEILAAYLNLYGKPIPNSLRRGLRDALECFSDYHIAKYQERGKAVTMADVVKICHPSRRSSGLFQKLIEGDLAVPTSWETEVAANGNNAETWEKLIADGNLGYMAALRNLRNMVKAKPSNLDDILSKLADPEEVRRSRQLPFRFYSAWKANAGAGTKVLDTLEAALEASMENLPKLPGKTAVFVDCSGSMDMPISRKSDVRANEIAGLLGIMLAKMSDDCVMYRFDDDAYPFPVSKRGGVLSQLNAMDFYGGCTNMGAPFQRMLDEGIECDRIIILSDNEVNDPYVRTGRGFWDYSRTIMQSLADEYRQAVVKDVWVHAIDLQGYGTQQFQGGKTNVIAGWSEKILEFVKLVEDGTGSLIEDIEETVV